METLSFIIFSFSYMCQGKDFELMINQLSMPLFCR